MGKRVVPVEPPPLGRTTYDALKILLRQASPNGSYEITLLGLLIFAYVLIAFVSHLHVYTAWKLFTKLLWKNATTRPPVLIVLILVGWSWVVKTCTQAGMELEKVLTGPTKAPLMGLSCAIPLLNVFLGAHLVHFVATEIPGQTWRPWLTVNFGLHVAYALIIVLPHKYLHSDARSSLVKTTWESLIAPFAPVTFWHVIVADYATSLAKAFADFQLMICITFSIAGRAEPSGTPYTRTTVLWEHYHPLCVSSPANCIMLALPFWCRFWQCLHVYSNTREQKNLWNALKYSSAGPLIYLGWYRRQYPSLMADRLFVLSAVVNSTYTFVWDVLMDWGMLQWDKERGCWSLRMREQTLISPKKSTYALLMIVNLALRFIWACAVFGTVPTRGHGMFIFESLEIMRRTVWAVFRIEWEYVAKVLPKDAAVYDPVEKDSVDGDERNRLLFERGELVEATSPEVLARVR